MRLLFASIISIGFLLISGCASTKGSFDTKKMSGSGSLTITKISNDETYGVTPENPVHVGGVEDGIGPASERKYLDQLRGPNGEEITYNRTSSCCSFDTPRGFMGSGLLDVYEIKYSGQEKPIKIYINMYDYQSPKAPAGFTIN